MYNETFKIIAGRLVAWTTVALALTAVALLGSRPGVATEIQVSHRTPMMEDVIRWMDGRHYDFITSHVGGDLVLSADFADESGKSQSCACVFAVNPTRDVLTVNASFSSAVSTGEEVAALSWVATVNGDSQWGFYGFDPEKHELWFRISLFRPEGRVEADELDRILNEILSAMRNASALLLPPSLDDPEPEDHEPTAPESDKPTRSRLYVKDDFRPPESSRISSVLRIAGS